MSTLSTGLGFVHDDIAAAAVTPDFDQGLFVRRLFAAATACSAFFTGLRLISVITSPGAGPASYAAESGSTSRDERAR